MATAPKPSTSKYVVAKADIWTSEGRKNEGDVVELTSAEAKHFVKRGYLAPYIVDDGGETISG